MKRVTYNEKQITFDNLEFKRLNDEGYFECRGEDEQGNLYSGIVHKSCGEYGEITDIEMLFAESERPSRTFDLTS